LGYSARYHAASLAAVFLALAVGILIGAGLGDTVLSNTEENLRESLEGDIEDAQRRASDLETELDRERQFGERAYPALVGNRLKGERVEVIALGDLPGGLSEEIEAALRPAGAELAQISVVRSPPDVAGLASEIDRKRYAKIEDDPDRLEELANRLGEQLARGRGKSLAATRDVLLSRSSGGGAPIDRVVLFRTAPSDGGSEDRASRDRFEAGIVTGVDDSGVPTVAVERSGEDASSVPFFASHDISTVDDVDLVSGRVAMIFALLGANGNFGIKGTADSLLPELLVSGRRSRAGG
jgi:hypothetical protein